MITTHVLDLARGRPVAGVPVVLEVRTGTAVWRQLAAAVTDKDGRVRDWVPADAELTSGIYRLTFNTAEYLRSRGAEVFFPEVTVVFEMRGGEHYHIPLLLSPYGYSTYRGS